VTRTKAENGRFWGIFDSGVVGDWNIILTGTSFSLEHQFDWNLKKAARL